jgi:cytochrome c-type biogenesis protein CcmH/NrfG
MRVASITAIADGDIDKEVTLLEKEAEKGSDDVELYIRLSSIYRIKENYQKAWGALAKAESLLT